MNNFDILTTDDLQRLMEEQNNCAISIYMPAHPESLTGDEDRIRFKNFLRQAEMFIEECDGGIAVEDLKGIDEARRLLTRENFWRNQNIGLAAFLTPGGMRTYRLPFPFKPFIHVAKRFYVKPLVPLLTRDGFFYILALSQNSVRLLACTRYNVSEVDIGELEGGIRSILKYDVEEAQLQSYSKVQSQDLSSNRQTAVYQGRGAGFEKKKEEITRYFRAIDRGIKDIIGDAGLPVVLAGVEYLLPLYRRVSILQNIMEEGITGNPETQPIKDTQKKGWEIVEAYFIKEQNAAIEQYRQMLGTGYAASGINDVLPAAAYGKVEVLFFERGEYIWGMFDSANNRIEVSSDNKPANNMEELIDRAVVETLAHGGRVYGLEPGEMEDRHPILAALLRY